MFLGERRGSLSILRGCLAGRTSGNCNFRQAEVENLCVAPPRNEDVCGLDVAMDNAFGVSSIQSTRNLDCQRQKSLGFHGTPRNAVLQRHAVQKLHGDERLAILFVNLVNRANVGMVEGGGSLSLALEPSQSLGILSYFVRQELQRHKPM